VLTSSDSHALHRHASLAIAGTGPRRVLNDRNLSFELFLMKT
jgi:hypothetical protein